MASDENHIAAKDGSRMSRAGRWLGRRLLAPTRRRFWKRVTLQLKSVRLFATELILLFIVVGGTVLVFREIDTPAIRISVSTVPEDLRTSGLTEAVATELMRAELEQIQVEAQTSMEYARPWREDQTIQFSIPGTGLGLGDVIQHVKRFLNKSDTTITVYMARTGGQLGVSFRASRQELPLTRGWIIGANEAELIHIAAEQIARATQPYVLASYYYSIQELDKCRQLVDEIHRVYPANTATRARAYNLSGIMLSDAGDDVGAVRAYEQALVHDPLAAYAQLNIGNIYLAQAKHEDAETAYQKAVAIDPNYVLGHSNLAHAFMIRGKTAEAEAAYRRALELNEKDEFAHSGLGDALSYQGKYDEAIVAYGRALELEQGNAVTWTNLCTAQFKSNLLEEAKVSCDRAVALAPGDPWVSQVFADLVGQGADLNMSTAGGSEDAADDDQLP